MELTDEEVERYSRHILLADVGVEGQQKISRGRVLIVGAGGLGSPVALYLAAAGVGTIGIIDGDLVDRGNLQRQVIHFTADIDKPKVLSARDKILQLNPGVTVVAYHQMLTAANALQLFDHYDFVVDGTDNFAAKFLVNDAAVIARKPFSHGAILRYEGQTMTFVPGTACYRCLFHAPPPPGAVPSCSEAGVLGAVAGMLGTIQAAEVLKFLAGVGNLLTNRLLTFDARQMEFKTLRAGHNPGCPVCGTDPSITRLHDMPQDDCQLTNHGLR
jgi:molybdopterin/thiamine biosynthesis adenylyltransferase